MSKFEKLFKKTKNLERNKFSQTSLANVNNGQLSQSNQSSQPKKTGSMFSIEMIIIEEIKLVELIIFRQLELILLSPIQK